MRHWFADLYRYRHLLANLVVTEVKLRYRRSVLGVLWTMLNPLLTMTVLAVVFNTIMRVNIPDYPAFLLAGLVPWIFFSQSVTQSLLSIVSRGGLLHKVYIPKAILPLSTVVAGLVNLLFALVPMLLIVLFLRGLQWSALFLPVPMLILFAFALGFALIFSSLTVFYRDFIHITEVLLSILMYLSPVIYAPANIPEQYRGLFEYNPLTHILTAFRAPLYDGVLPSGRTLALAAASATITLVVGWIAFRLRENELVLRV
jgi:ABC-2 type transport system permease protein